MGDHRFREDSVFLSVLALHGSLRRLRRRCRGVNICISFIYGFKVGRQSEGKKPFFCLSGRPFLDSDIQCFSKRASTSYVTISCPKLLRRVRRELRYTILDGLSKRPMGRTKSNCKNEIF